MCRTVTFEEYPNCFNVVTSSSVGFDEQAERLIGVGRDDDAVELLTCPVTSRTWTPPLSRMTSVTA